SHRRIDVNHVGALVGQHDRRERPGDVLAEVDDSDPHPPRPSWRMMVIRAENVFRLEALARTLLRRTHAESACVALGGGNLLTATRGATNRRLRSNMEQLTLSRRRALGLIASGLGTIVAASCGVPAPTTPATSVAGSSPSKPAPAAASATPQPKTGGTLRYGSDVDVNRLDPHFRLGDVYYTVYYR